MRYSNVVVFPRNHSYTNAQGTLRKAFTDHAVYTKFVVTDIIEQLPNLTADLDRLMKNQEEIGHLVSLSVGPEKGTIVINALKEHVRLAGEAVKAIKTADLAQISRATNMFLDQAESVGRFLSSLNPEKLPVSSTIEAFKKHSQYVIDIANAQKNRATSDVVTLYDAYFGHMMSISDALYEALFH
jgi:hypothetical protein